LGHRCPGGENFARRRPDRVSIPVAPAAQVSGFSVEVIQEALGGTWEPLLNAIKAGQIRGPWGWWGATTKLPRTMAMST
jgi:hydroxylamine reductase (hybrid-cluster protein)